METQERELLKGRTYRMGNNREMVYAGNSPGEGHKFTQWADVTKGPIDILTMLPNELYRIEDIICDRTGRYKTKVITPPSLQTKQEFLGSFIELFSLTSKFLESNNRNEVLKRREEKAAKKMRYFFFQSLLDGVSTQ